MDLLCAGIDAIMNDENCVISLVNYTSATTSEAEHTKYRLEAKKRNLHN